MIRFISITATGSDRRGDFLYALAEDGSVWIAAPNTRLPDKWVRVTEPAPQPSSQTPEGSNG